MKTIKELEAELNNETDRTIRKYLIGQLNYAKDVLGLIDELQRYGPILAKKLKARITG